MEESDLRITEAMEKYGGSFVKALAVAARRADPYNLGKLRQTFKEYWSTYDEMSRPKL